ncbi:hypothetical protein [Rubrimonas cliftonensis]|uniref:MSP domain-containing protein n=1 Tax=Rubrimonas cliftonensis TaxID=89524 RepID=A0A1H4GGR5_9RHOB|nr:hypothetical protein [Rubrimonas cliftonensis]SEB08754.1 hypothetical protein SAMN05444370_1703 [Rubrimonas cliftonensis]
MKSIAIAGLLAAAVAAPAAFAPGEAAAQDRTITLGFAGLMDRRNRVTLPPINLSVGKPLADAPIELVSGGYYQIEINADGTGELAIGGASFFRNIWINEVVINDLEVRPIGLDSFEFDAAGTIEMSFIAIRPGQYEMRIPGTSGDTQKVDIIIR